MRIARPARRERPVCFPPRFGEVFGADFGLPDADLAPADDLRGRFAASPDVTDARVRGPLPEPPRGPLPEPFPDPDPDLRFPSAMPLYVVS